MPRTLRPVATLVTAAALLLAACGDEQDDTSTATTDTSTSPTSDAPDVSISTTASPAGTDTESDPETEADTDAETDTDAESAADGPAADLVIVGTLSQGDVTVDARRFEVPIGSSVLISFESDETEHIHLHGYDLLVDLAPGEPAELAFVADSPGSFEVELEDSGRFLFELLVR